jgi:hypothetical protein
MTWGWAGGNAGGARKKNIVGRGVVRSELERLHFLAQCSAPELRSSFSDALRSGGIDIASQHWRHAGREVDRIKKCHRTILATKKNSA